MNNSTSPSRRVQFGWKPFLKCCEWKQSLMFSSKQRLFNILSTEQSTLTVCRSIARNLTFTRLVSSSLRRFNLFILTLTTHHISMFQQLLSSTQSTSNSHSKTEISSTSLENVDEYVQYWVGQLVNSDQVFTV